MNYKCEQNLYFVPYFLTLLLHLYLRHKTIDNYDYVIPDYLCESNPNTLFHTNLPLPSLDPHNQPNTHNLIPSI